MIRRSNFRLVAALVLLFSLFVGSCAPRPGITPTLTGIAFDGTQPPLPIVTTTPSNLPPIENPTGTSNAPVFGSISGELSYPGEFIPPLLVVAFQVGGEQYFFIKTSSGQSNYRLDGLPPGNYYVIAYPLEPGHLENPDLAGGYTQAVLCGLGIECTDHSLIEIIVRAGQETSGINPADWYAPPGSYPPTPSLP